MILLPLIGWYDQRADLVRLLLLATLNPSMLLLRRVT